MTRPITITLYEHQAIEYKKIRENGETIQEALFKLNKHFKNEFRRLKKSNDNPDDDEELDESKGVVEVYAKKSRPDTMSALLLLVMYLSRFSQRSLGRDRRTIVKKHGNH